MKGFLGLFLLSLTLFSIGQELDLSGDFTGPDARWVLHGFEGFKPFAKLTVSAEGGEGKKILQIRSVRGELGALLFHRNRFPSARDNRVRVTLRLRGKGIAAVCLHFFTKEGKWNGPSHTSNIKLKKQWESISVIFPVFDGFAGRTHSFRVCIGCGPGSEMDASDVKAVFHKGKE